MMTEFIDWPLRRVLAIEGLPGWLAPTLELVWVGLKVTVTLMLAWLVSRLARRAVVALGKRRLKADEAFDGSSWDLGASLVQFLILVISAPAIIAVAGFNVLPYVEAHVFSVAVAFAILAAGIALARWTATSIRSFGARARRGQHGDETLFKFIASLARYGLVGLAGVLALQQLGFNAGSLIAIVGAVGLALALALQDTLRAVASGVMLAIFRPYRIGDWVLIAGAEGEIVDVTPFHTTLLPVDNRTVVIPNDKAWSDTITNFSRQRQRRLDLYFDVAYEDDVDQALEVMKSAVAELAGVRRRDETWCGVHELGAYSVRLRLRVWIDRASVLNMRSDCIRAVKAAFAAAGITIPYPTQLEYQLAPPGSKKPS